MADCLYPMIKLYGGPNFWYYDIVILFLPGQDVGMKALEGNYCDKMRQIGAIRLEEYYDIGN